MVPDSILDEVEDFMDKQIGFSPMAGYTDACYESFQLNGERICLQQMISVGCVLRRREEQRIVPVTQREFNYSARALLEWQRQR